MAKNRFADMAGNMKKAVEKSDLQVSKKSKDNNLIEIEIASIQNPPFHDRYSVDRNSIRTLAEDISLHGLINPISVRKLENGQFQRIAGYRRIEAHKLLGKTVIAAIVFEDKNDIDVIELMFSENHNREDPSEYDLIIFHLEALAYMLNKQDDELKSIVSKARKIEQGTLSISDNELLSQVDVIKELLLKTKIFSSINSFYQRMTNTLALDMLLVEAMQAKKIYYSIAVELNKVHKANKSEDEINNFFIKSINANYTLSEAKDEVGRFLTVDVAVGKLEQKKNDIKKKIKHLAKKVDELDINALEELDKWLSEF